MCRPCTPRLSTPVTATWPSSWSCSSSVASRWSSSRSSRANSRRRPRSTTDVMRITLDNTRRHMVAEGRLREVRHFSGEWLNKQLKRHLGPPPVEDKHSRCTDDGSAMDSESAQVREFIERLVESLISGGLDQVNVNRLYTHPDYKPLDETDSPSAAHADLKKLIHHVVREAMTLPALSQNGSVHSKAVQDDVSSKTYEDILATAILNKVIQRFQQYTMGSPGIGVDGNSNQLPGREEDQRPKFISRVEIGMASSNSIDDDTSAIDDGSWSGSSHTEPLSLTIEECVEEEMTTYNNSSDDEGHGEETAGAELDFYLSGLNFIKKHRVPFPELGMDIVDGGEESGEEDEGEREAATSPQPTDLVSPVDSWEDNWLFQRRRLKTLGSRDPVPMLVPNPSEDFRALIGDRDAEEISDLSDCSESALEDVLDDLDEDLVPATKKSLIQKTSSEISSELQGQRSTEESLTGPQIKVSSSPEECPFEANHELDLVEARNIELSNGMDSLLEFGQQDSEYTEDYTSATRRQMNSLKRHQGIETTNCKPVPQPRNLQNSCEGSVDDSSKKELAPEYSSELSLESFDSVNELATPPRPGTIAEREHKKWESAVPLPNNPYSSENIMKRLNKSSHLDIRTNCRAPQEKAELPEIQNESKVEKTVAPHQENDANITRYGRDYYINASKRSSGSRNQIARPVEIVPTVTADRPQAEPVAKSTRVSTPLEKSPARVGSEVSRWQKEINQTEEMWLKKINGCKPESDIKDNDLEPKSNKTVTNQNKNNCDKDTILIQTNGINSTQKIPNINGDKINESVLESNQGLTNGNKHSETNNNVSTVKTPPTSNISSEDSPELPSKHSNGHAVIQDDMCNKDNREQLKLTNGRVKINVSASPSEGSISSDGELNVSMPSVKDLAKHFTTHNTKTKSQQPLDQSSVRQVSTPMDQKRVVVRPVDGSNQPMREVHSLTARSISREFREELKRNLPSQRDRNMHSSDSSLARSDSSLDQGPPSLLRGSDFDTSTTPGYTSDESSAPSPVPGTLRNNIAFWEQMQRNK